MQRIILSFVILFGTVLMAPADDNNLLYAAHILEPLGTEIAATPPRGRMFGQIEYAFSKDDPDGGEEITSHTLPLEFEIGVGGRTQLNLEAEVLLEESNGETKNGIKEMAFGLKHRFLDETKTVPDMAFLVEFAPAAGLKGDEAELKGTFLATKNFTNRFLTHVEVGYLHETEREGEVGASPGEVEVKVENASILVYNIAPIYRIIPDRILLMVEINGKTNFKKNDNKVTIAPEVILVRKNTALKLAIPIGITNEADDIGFRIGISQLFR